MKSCIRIALTANMGYSILEDAMVKYVVTSIGRWLEIYGINLKNSFIYDIRLAFG